MKKVLSFFMVLPLLVACTNGSTGQVSSQDSMAVAIVEQYEDVKPEVKSSTFAIMADSIYKAHPGDINNEIIQEDISKDLKKYVLQFKGKHMPLVEELPFKLTDVIKEGGHYVAAFQYKKDADQKNLGLELQLKIDLPREKAGTLVTEKYYTVKGIMTGFPYSRAVLQPNVVTPLSSYEKPLLSLGVLQVRDAEITQK